MRYVRVLCLGLLLCCAASQTQAASVEFGNQDAPGTGFNDSTHTRPLGGNQGKTLGRQRQIALSYAASIVASRVGSRVPILIAASFSNADNPLPCDKNTATLGAARPTQYAVNFPSAPRDDTFYPLALADALAGTHLTGDNSSEIAVHFNPALDRGARSCLGGMSWYYGLDGHPGRNQIDFVASAVHELLHGFGFLSTVTLADRSDSDAGQFPATTQGDRYPDIFSRFIQDLSIPGEPLWTELTAAERADSLTDGPNVVWSDSVTDNAAAGLLSSGLQQGRVRLYAPASVSPGSSVSHWDDSLSPNAIMEPFANPDTSVLSGIGLSACVLENMGWQLINNTRCPDIGSPTIAGQPDPSSANDASDDGHHGGGGCTMAPDSAFDPLWGLLLAGALMILGWRRRRAAADRAGR